MRVGQPGRERPEGRQTTQVLEPEFGQEIRTLKILESPQEGDSLGLTMRLYSF